MKNLYLVLGLVCSFVFTAVAQHSDCSTEVTQKQYEYLSQQKEARELFQVKMKSSEIYQVPLQIHILRKSDGTGGMPLAMLKNELEHLNELYKPSNIQFYLGAEVNYIDRDEYYNFHQEDEGKIVEEHEMPNMINLYFAGKLYNKLGNEICGYTYMAGKDRVFLSKLCSADGVILAHELGHYFSLYHTHGNNFTQQEYADGSNCDAGGDEICDTPADPGLSGKVNSNCQYTGTAVDAKGNPFKPDTKNIMSYSTTGCREYFSQEQYDRILFSYLNDRQYLKSEETYDLIVEDHAELQMDIFPNPTTGYIKVALNKIITENYQVDIYDVTGRMVHHRNGENLSGDGVTVDLSGFGKGIYFVNVIADNRSLTKRIILQ